MRPEFKENSCVAVDRDRNVEELQRIRNARLAEILATDKPLKGIYCVYSMYWHPKPANSED